MSLNVRLVQKVWETENFEKFTNREDKYYTANITHNLGKMAKACGLYEVLWRPYLLFRKDFENYDEEMEYEDSLTIKARQLIKIMEKGLRELKSHPEKYKTYDSPNSWGLYENFVPFVEKYLKACKKYPNLLVQVDR
jgi:hypothetical protein